MTELLIRKACPTCHTEDTIVLSQDHIFCKKKSCDFHIKYDCPLCNGPLDDVVFKNDNNGTYYTCLSCHRAIHLRRIQHLFDNQMRVDYDKSCKFCNGPTVHRQDANMGHRCFFFPKCSGQSSLFGQQKESIVFLDFETSGLEATKDHITEIGALKIDEEGFEESFESLIQVPVTLSEKVTSLTGITNDMLMNAPSLDSVMEKFIEFLGDSLLVAHNAEFDVPWLLINASRLNLSINTSNIICTFKWARQVGESRCSLSALTKKYKIGHLNAHRALADAAATKELFFIFDQVQLNQRPTESIQVYKDLQFKLESKYKSRQEKKLKVVG